MRNKILFLGVAGLLALSGAAFSQRPPKINDAQIAHIAYTAGVIDVAAGKQALAISSSSSVRAFAEEMIRDHEAVNDRALALVKKLDVTPENNPTSVALTKQAVRERQILSRLRGAAFDRAYVANEVAYHRAVNAVLKDSLIPGARNGELKFLLRTGLALFAEHQKHAEHLARTKL